MKLDANSGVPLSWLVSTVVMGSIPLITGAMWVQTVNDRLSRIEEKLAYCTKHRETSWEKKDDARQLSFILQNVDTYRRRK